MNVFDQKKQKALLILLSLATIFFHLYNIKDIIAIYKEPIKIFPTSLTIIIINLILFLIIVSQSKNVTISYISIIILFFNIYISFIEPFRTTKIQIIIDGYNRGFYDHIVTFFELLKHISYLLNAKAFHIAYVLSAYHKQNKTLKKSICLLLLQFIPLIGTLAITRELFYDHTIDKRIVLVFCFISVLFFIVSLYILFYIGYMIHSF